MTQLNPPRASERISRILLQSAVVVAAVVWVSERNNGNSLAELEQARGHHSELQTLRAERDLLRSDVWALRDQLQQVLRENERVHQQMDRMRSEASPALVAMAPTSTLSPSRDEWVPPRAVPQPVPPVIEKVVPKMESKAPLATDSSVISAALVQPSSSIVDDGEEVSETMDLVSVAPSLGDFNSGKRSSKKLSLADETDLSTVALEDFQPAFDRSRAEGMWQEALAEAADTECRRQRGLARSRCESEISDSLAPYSALAIQCIMTGNARPDYVQGVATSSVPSHGVSLEQGAIIFCDAELANR